MLELIVGFYLSAEMQSVYSTAPTEWISKSRYGINNAEWLNCTL